MQNKLTSLTNTKTAVQAIDADHIVITPPQQDQTSVTLPDGTVIEGNFTISPPAVTYSISNEQQKLQMLKQELEMEQNQLQNSQSRVDSLQAQVDDQQDLVDQLVAAQPVEEPAEEQSIEQPAKEIV